MTTFVFPGQGSQKVGMGEGLFDKYSDLTAKADEILGYSIKELCLEDPRRQLTQTRFTQPALYVVNAFMWLDKKEQGARPDFLAGHSLGEYNALFAAGSFDFETGLRLVQKRGELMSRARPGGMAAVIRLSREKMEETLKENDLENIDMANFNSPTQIVISGPKEDIERAQPFFEKAGARMYSVLRVGSAFHSRYMQDAKEEFAEFLAGFELADPSIPVIANVLARPYPPGKVRDLLAEQITTSVRWTETIQYLMGKGEEEYVETGPGRVLAGLVKQIKNQAEPLIVADEEESPDSPATAEVEPEESSPARAEPEPLPPENGPIRAENLGSESFKKDYGVRLAYLAGAMSSGTGSEELVIRLSKAGLLGFLWTGGMAPAELEASIRRIQAKIGRNNPYGMSLISNMSQPTAEDGSVDVFLKLGVRNVEAIGFLQMTPGLVRYRLKGLRRKAGGVHAPHRIIAVVTRPEVAGEFMSPAPERIVKKLLEASQITAGEAELSRLVPMSGDICVEADSGGPTDQGVAYALMPALLRQRDEMMARFRYDQTVRVGASGGLGAPEALAAALILGAEFVMTGSINQCTVEANTSDMVKDMLQRINVQDTAYAPSVDMFEMGEKVQVLKRGLFFPSRANKLFALYQQYNSLEDIDAKSRQQIQEKYFRRGFDQVWAEVRRHYLAHKPDEIEKAERNPKHRMVLVFKWYLRYAHQLALSGSSQQKVDFQVHCGPAMGAFNQWVKGTTLEDWRNRHVEDIAERLMRGAANYLSLSFQRFTAG